MRGEDPMKEKKRPQKRETPPRAWGRPNCPVLAEIDLGNTPTCVGKTRQAPSDPKASWKHPHVRGEDLIIRIVKNLNLETPPRAWGRPPPTVQEKYFLKKHPHVRGEDEVRALSEMNPVETPPRAWGRR